MILQALVRHLPGVQVLQGGECSANSAFSQTHYPLQSPPVLRGAVAQPGSDASCQDALHHTSVEGLKETPLSPQLPEVIEALLCLPHQSVCIPGQILCDVDSQVPVASHPLHSSPINPQWCVSPPMLLCRPKVHNQLLSF